LRRNSGIAEARSSRGRVLIRLPRNWYDGQLKNISLGLPDSAANIAFGANIANQINSDYSLGQFDRSLAKYKPKSVSLAEPVVVSLTVSDLWEKYCQYKATSWKVKTIDYYRRLGVYVDRMPDRWENPLAIREWLLANTTQNIAARVLKTLQTVLDWAIRCRLISEQRNPYMGMGAELLGKRQPPPPANAFSVAEVAQILHTFSHSERWSYYAPFVHFLLLTGCRPSEAVGLTWGQIATDFSTIRFDRSVVKVDRKYEINHLSKTNRSRLFPCSRDLVILLAELQPAAQGELVFPSPAGKYLDYEHLAHRPWVTLVFPIVQRHTTPYSCRDTFITNEIALGKPAAIIAKWVDNSIKMIEGKYLDIDVINLKPG
jgi:integrase